MKQTSTLLPNGEALKRLGLKQLPLLWFLLAFLQLPTMVLAQNGKNKDDIIPILECVRYVGNGKYEATFGYDNKNKNDVNLTESTSYLTSPTFKPNGKPIKNFKAGRKQAAFKVEFDGKKLTWTVVLPNGKIKTVI